MFKQSLLAASLIASLTLTVVGATSVSAAEASAVVIPDEALAAALNAELGREAGSPITQDEIESLEWLYAPDLGIVDLTGLEHASQLTYLYMGGNQITDLSPVTSLSGLQWIDLAGNPISALPDMSTLTNLGGISLDGTQTSDLVPLASLPNLDWVSATNTEVSDVSMLADRTRTLIMDGARVRDISTVTDYKSSSFMGQRVDGGTVYVPAGATHFTQRVELPVGFGGTPWAPEVGVGMTVDGDVVTWSTIGETLEFSFGSMMSFSGTVTYKVVQAELSSVETTPAVVGTESMPLTVKVTDGFEVAEYRLVSGEVPGMTFDAATGELSGTPTTAGTYELTVHAVDPWGNVVPADFSLTVALDDGSTTEPPAEGADGDGSQEPGTGTEEPATPGVDGGTTDPTGPTAPVLPAEPIDPSAPAEPAEPVAGQPELSPAVVPAGDEGSLAQHIAGAEAAGSEDQAAITAAGGSTSLASTGSGVVGLVGAAGILLAAGIALALRAGRAGRAGREQRG